MSKQDPSFTKEKIQLLEDTNIEQTSMHLAGVKVTVVSGGGIAAIEVPKLVRELRRHGAWVQVCMTENCFKFVGIESMRWASQNEVIFQPSGLSEHICTSDVIVVVPATADLISKIRHGICSDAATTLIQSALGMKKPILFCQTMHDSLALSPIIQENKSFLQSMQNIYFLEPRKEEGKQKIPDTETLATTICHFANKHIHSRKENILVTLGGTRVMIDPVRCLTNISTGSLGISVANYFYCQGYSITILAGVVQKPLPYKQNIEIHELPNYQDMFEFCLQLDHKKYFALIHLVAGSDFTPKTMEKDKIKSSQENFILHFNKVKKLISDTNLNKIKYRAAAKLTSGEESQAEGLTIAKKLLKENHLNAVFWSTAKSAWNKNQKHSGIFLRRVSQEIESIAVGEKKEIPALYFQSFQKDNL